MTFTEPDRNPRFPGEGFRVEPEFRQASGSPESPLDELEVIRYAPGAVTPALPAGRPAIGSGSAARAVTAAELDGAFDDPEQGERGRDRLGVHLAWEAVLLVACAGMAYGLAATHTSPFGGENLKVLLRGGAIFGGLALAASLSLRAAAVNLAIGPIAIVASLYFAQHQSDGFYSAAGVAIAIAAGFGAVMAVVTVIAHVPAWAASLAGTFGALIWATHLPDGILLSQPYDTDGQSYYWFGAFAVISIAGGVVCAMRPIRRRFGAYRPVSDPADRRPAVASLVASVALLVSSLIAGIVGVASAAFAGAASTADNGLLLTGVGIGIALLGGVSAYGRRGGLFGTVLATVLLGLAYQWTTIHHWRNSELELVGVALAVGVLVTRLIEAFGRPLRGAAYDASAGPLSWLDRQESLVTKAPEPTVVDAADPRWGAR